MCTFRNRVSQQVISIRVLLAWPANFLDDSENSFLGEYDNIQHWRHPNQTTGVVVGRRSLSSSNSSSNTAGLGPCLATCHMVPPRNCSSFIKTSFLMSFSPYLDLYPPILHISKRRCLSLHYKYKATNSIQAAKGLFRVNRLVALQSQSIQCVHLAITESCPHAGHC
jgi:hypothetical protein